MFSLLKTCRPSEIRAFESVQPSSMSHRTKQETLMRLFVSYFTASVSAPQLLKSEHFQRVSANVKLNVFLGFVRLSLAFMPRDRK